MGLCGTWKETLWNAGHGTLWNMRINSQTQARTPNVPRVSATAPPTATTPRRGGCRRPDPMCAEKEDAVSSVAVQRVQIVRRPRGAAASRLPSPPSLSPPSPSLPSLSPPSPPSPSLPSPSLLTTLTVTLEPHSTFNLSLTLTLTRILNLNTLILNP